MYIQYNYCIIPVKTLAPEVPQAALRALERKGKRKERTFALNFQTKTDDEVGRLTKISQL